MKAYDNFIIANTTLHKTIYKSVRSYCSFATGGNLLLNEALDDGWQIVDKSLISSGEDNKYGYIEYILSKVVEIPLEEMGDTNS